MNIGKPLEEELDTKIFKEIRKDINIQLFNLTLLDKHLESITNVTIKNIMHHKITAPVTRETSIRYEYR